MGSPVALADSRSSTAEVVPQVPPVRDLQRVRRARRPPSNVNGGTVTAS